MIKVVVVAPTSSGPADQKVFEQGCRCCHDGVYRRVLQEEVQNLTMGEIGFQSNSKYFNVVV